MMAPKYERLNMIGVALQEAVHALDEPIDRVEVRGSRVIVGAAGRRVVLECGCAGSFDSEGRPLLGGGSWSARIVSGAPAGDGERREGGLFNLFRR